VRELRARRPFVTTGAHFRFVRVVLRGVLLGGGSP
jgi:hypothetical protein